MVIVGKRAEEESGLEGRMKGFTTTGSSSTSFICPGASCPLGDWEPPAPLFCKDGKTGSSCCFGVAGRGVSSSNTSPAGGESVGSAMIFQDATAQQCRVVVARSFMAEVAGTRRQQPVLGKKSKLYV
jgi:hypothetical protein